jgi:hypothetical protein
MKVGDLVRRNRWPQRRHRSEGLIGIIVGVNPLDGRFMVQWNGMPKPYPDPRHYLEVISESR